MGPLSARLLMQRGRPKSDRLGKIRSLDLSGLKLLSEHLDPKLLSRLKQLQELDLSNNQLETLPANLGLSHLRVLRCANNQLGDVTALCQFPQLEELSLEGNPFLTVSDNLKVSFLLPKLRKVNGKDASSTCSQVENLNRELTSRVTAHWEKFKAALSPEEAEKAQADFVRSAVRDVRYGPESLSEFTQWRVRMISEELVASGGIQVREADIPERPPKATAAREPRAKPAALKRPDDTPLSLSPNKRVCTSSSSAHVEGSDGSQPTLEPLHFLQCHSKNNSPRDLETQLWACAFEPAWEEGMSLVGRQGRARPRGRSRTSYLDWAPGNATCRGQGLSEWGAWERPPTRCCKDRKKELQGQTSQNVFIGLILNTGQAGATSQTVATCGGEAVCVIDCQTGIVLHKYKAPGEEFFSVAWTALTVVTQAGHKKRWSVLAAAGLRGLVRLLHVQAGFCCGVIRAHKKAIATLCFSPTHETHLFTASYDKRIILWDLGVPNHDYEFQASQLLTLDTTSIPLRLCPVASCPDTYLLAGCEGGCCCWDVRLDQPQKRRVCEVEFVFSEGAEAAGRRVDGLAFVNEDVVASKGNSLGTICLWSWSQTWVGRGKQSTLAVVVLARLQWSPTKLAYFSLSTCPAGEGIVLCGDEEGNVWVYDVRHILTQPSPLPAAPQAPTQILKWPQPWALGQMVTKTMVNTVVANPTFTYLTALTDSNIVAIWKRQ
ncbi:leucine-rich repeat and WD repeat-containing protein 1 isoform X1 [Vulpes vulpes]|uniref:Leucine-rich repeat and WD repeat-containing protein 1 n=1 Tax=Vulpes vulpes TaxID=9627 RepID=A0A3Q7U0I5_VULVU|nr:leucine-rich repeat and WD repeat-containing protein 1 isoform X1 [Vulpes vulpes]